MSLKSSFDCMNGAFVHNSSMVALERTKFPPSILNPILSSRILSLSVIRAFFSKICIWLVMCRTGSGFLVRFCEVGMSVSNLVESTLSLVQTLQQAGYLFIATKNSQHFTTMTVFFAPTD